MNERITALLAKGEWILSLGAVLGLGLKMSQLPAGSMLIILSIGSLAMLYFLEGYAPGGDGAAPSEKLINKLNAMGSSIGMIGILFLIQNWPGAKMMVLAGCFGLIASAAMIVNAKSKKGESDFLKHKKVKRTLLIAAAGLILFLTPSKILLDLHVHRPVVSHPVEMP